MTKPRTKNNNWRTACIAICVPLLLETALILTSRTPRDNGHYTTVKTDTTYVRDTILVDKPVHILTTPTTDTVTVPVTDTVRIRDTVYIRLPIEQKHYTSSDYEAWVSGYQPSLDSLKIFRTTMTLTTLHEKTTLKNTRWTLGIQAGYGIVHTRQGIAPGPYIGIGITYKIFPPAPNIH